MQGAGYLAIWSDLTPEDETDWAHWITREHAAERVGVNGFLACRIFRAIGMAVNRYFILYELENDNVVGNPDYLARLNAPTPWSQRIMPKLGGFARGGGRIAASAGIGQGGIVAPLRLDAAPAFDAAKVTAELAGLDRIIAARVLLTDVAQTSIKTNEKGMRANDDSFAAASSRPTVPMPSTRCPCTGTRSACPSTCCRGKRPRPLGPREPCAGLFVIPANVPLDRISGRNDLL
jgi:hypothetical protein